MCIHISRLLPVHLKCWLFSLILQHSCLTTPYTQFNLTSSSHRPTTMCGGMCYPIYIPAPRPAGWIKPDLTRLDAAARQSRERPKRVASECDMLDGSVSETSTLASLSFKDCDSTQGFSEKDNKITAVEGRIKSSRSFRDRWLDFKRKHLP